MAYLTLLISPARLCGTLPREVLVGGALALASAAALAGVSQSAARLDTGARLDAMVRPMIAPPAPEPLLVRDIAPDTALRVNQEIPLATGPNPAARPFQTDKVAADARLRAIDCLAEAVYYEAGSESDAGQRAVAQVVLNRVRHPAYPSSICGVVYQGSQRVTGCQFTFTCDGALARRPGIAGMAHARRIAQAALAGSVYAPVGTATHYHTDYVVPYWAASLDKAVVIGTHIFYRWSGGWGRPAAFAQRYAGREAEPGALRAAALTTERTDQATLVQGPLAALVTTVPGTSGKRVALRFSPAARAAVEAAPHRDYVDKVQASPNLRWSLDQTPAAMANEVPLGRAAERAAGSSASPAASPAAAAAR